jgi:hypothetical protein
LFQSTRPHGRERDDRHGRGRLLLVSIHAPVRTRTPRDGRKAGKALFQSTRPHGREQGTGKRLDITTTNGDGPKKTSVVALKPRKK